MSLTYKPAAALNARQAHQITKKFTAQLTGRGARGADRKVRRGSVDVDDRRARVSRPIGDGSKAGALSWIDCLLKTVTEWDNHERQKGGGRPLGLYGIRVLEVLLGRHGKVAIHFKSGDLFPEIETIARAAGTSKTTVVRALARLKAMKILNWIRRTEKTGNDGLFGPQRRQISNAYWFTPEALPARVLQRLRDLLARRRLRKAEGAPPPPEQPQGSPLPSCPELRAALARLSEGVNAIPPSGQYPSSGIKG
jgi:hypothetical protein